jgi:hypothetical protein
MGARSSQGLVLREAQKMAERPEEWLRQFAEFREAAGAVWGAVQHDLDLLDKALAAERALKKQLRKGSRRCLTS